MRALLRGGVIESLRLDGATDGRLRSRGGEDLRTGGGDLRAGERDLKKIKNKNQFDTLHTFFAAIHQIGKD